MKAKEAPEKVYITPHFHRRWFTKEIDYASVEYIRADYAKKRFIVDAKTFLSEIHRVCDITDENGYRIELRDLQARFENYMEGK